MAITTELYGANVSVPEEDDAYGDTFSSVLASVIAGVNSGVAQSGSSYYPKGTVATNNSVASAGNISRTAHKMRVQSTSGAITLDTTTPIAVGTTDGEELVIVGLSDSNTITIPDSGTAAGLNGDITLTSGVTIVLWWDDTSSIWREICRSN